MNIFVIFINIHLHSKYVNLFNVCVLFNHMTKFEFLHCLKPVWGLCCLGICILSLCQMFGPHVFSAGLCVSSTCLHVLSIGLHVFSACLQIFSACLHVLSAGLHVFPVGLRVFSAGLHVFSAGLRVFSTTLFLIKGSCLKNHCLDNGNGVGTGRCKLSGRRMRKSGTFGTGVMMSNCGWWVLAVGGLGEVLTNKCPRGLELTDESSVCCSLWIS